ncbi:hypothetical protein HZC00_04455 [Candidatus Kaiserbacteria bacterium]|nr:hypothetical protein [Candidatus Kaiserbacteria bacterium]
MGIKTNHKRASRVFGILLEAFREVRYPYNVAVLPQDMVPAELRKDPLRHAQFLWYACHFMRGALDSTTAIRQLVTLWSFRPDLFMPEKVVTIPLEEIKGQLVRALNYHIDEIGVFWQENSARLIKYWRGDPRLIFHKLKDGADLRRRVMNKRTQGTRPSNELLNHEQGFEGFQAKMTSMLAYFLIAEKLVSPIEIIPAVDFHLLRVMFETEILVPDTYERRIGYDEAYKYGANLLECYLKRDFSRSVELADALWLLSSNLCALAPGNRSVGRSTRKNYRDGKKTLPQVLNVDPDDLNHQRWYARSCARCPISDACVRNVPSGPYYEVGMFMIHPRRRMEVPQELFPLDTCRHPHTAPRRYKTGNLMTPSAEIQLVLDIDDPDI